MEGPRGRPPHVSEGTTGHCPGDQSDREVGPCPGEQRDACAGREGGRGDTEGPGSGRGRMGGQVPTHQKGLISSERRVGTPQGWSGTHQPGSRGGNHSGKRVRTERRRERAQSIRDPHLLMCSCRGGGPGQRKGPGHRTRPQRHFYCVSQQTHFFLLL